jgi:hypothetical protein
MTRPSPHGILARTPFETLWTAANDLARWQEFVLLVELSTIGQRTERAPAT